MIWPPVDVKHTEDLSKHLFRASITHNVENHLNIRKYPLLSLPRWYTYHEFYKINIAVIVGIVHSEHVFLHFVSIIPLWQSLKKIENKSPSVLISNLFYLFHHFAEVLLLHLAIWVFGDEGVELLSNILWRKGSVRSCDLNICGKFSDFENLFAESA